MVFSLQEITTALQGSFGKDPLCFDMTSSYMVDDVGATSVVMRTSCNKKILVTVLLAQNDFEARVISYHMKHWLVKKML
jgi:hypothetical protein